MAPWRGRLGPAGCRSLHTEAPSRSDAQPSASSSAPQPEASSSRRNRDSCPGRVWGSGSALRGGQDPAGLRTRGCLRSELAMWSSEQMPSTGCSRGCQLCVEGQACAIRGWVCGSELNHGECARTQIQSPVMFLIQPLPPVLGKSNSPSDEAAGNRITASFPSQGLSCDGRAQRKGPK